MIGLSRTNIVVPFLHHKDPDCKLICVRIVPLLSLNSYKIEIIYDKKEVNLELKKKIMYLV